MELGDLSLTKRALRDPLLVLPLKTGSIYRATRGQDTFSPRSTGHFRAMCGLVKKGQTASVGKNATSAPHRDVPQSMNSSLDSAITSAIRSLVIMPSTFSVLSDFTSRTTSATSAPVERRRLITSSSLAVSDTLT